MICFLDLKCWSCISQEPIVYLVVLEGDMVSTIMERLPALSVPSKRADVWICVSLKGKGNLDLQNTESWKKRDTGFCENWKYYRPTLNAGLAGLHARSSSNYPPTWHTLTTSMCNQRMSPFKDLVRRPEQGWTVVNRNWTWGQSGEGEGMPI